MNENQVTDIIKDVVSVQAKEIYEDGFKGATQEGGEALKAIVGLFNNVVLYPLKKANISFKYKLEEFEKDLKENMKHIPKENIIEPPISIIGPTIESLKYTFDSEELRNMYMNLLTSSMDIEKISYAHPSYVEIIKQMTPLDANVLKQLVDISKREKYIPCANVKLVTDGKVFTRATPNIFCPLIKLNDINPFLISASIENLKRLGMINHNEDAWSKTYNYDKIKSELYFIDRLTKCRRANPDKVVDISIQNQVLIMTNFGENFSKACL